MTESTGDKSNLIGSASPLRIMRAAFVVSADVPCLGNSEHADIDCERI